MTSIPSSLPPDAWADHITAWRESKLTRSEYCRQRGLKLNEFLYRLSRHRIALAKTLTLIPVSVETAPAPSSSSELVLRGPQGWSLSMSGDVSAAWLGQLLGTLS
jgi:hypothetical protein